MIGMKLLRRHLAPLFVAQTNVAIDGIPALVLDGTIIWKQTRRPGRDRVVLLVRDRRVYAFHLSTRATGFDTTAQAAFANLMTSTHWQKPAAAGARPL